MNRIHFLGAAASACLLALIITCALPTPPEFNSEQARVTISPDQAPGAQDTVGHPLKFTITYGEANWLDMVLVLIKDPAKSSDSVTSFRSFPAEGISFRHTFDSPGPKHFV